MHWLPTLNAVLNTTSAVLLLAGYRFIRTGRVEAHRRAMLGAFTVSCLFLVSYLYYHAQVGSVHYQGTGLLRGIYLAILASHSLLAAAAAPMAAVTLWRGLKDRRESHRALARWTLPVWVYVSVTGVVVYLMLYHLG